MSTTPVTFGTINAALHRNVQTFADHTEAVITTAGFTITENNDGTLTVTAPATNPELATVQLAIPEADWVTQMGIAIRSLSMVRSELVTTFDLDQCAMELTDAMRAVYDYRLADDPAAQLILTAELVRWQLDGLRAEIAIWPALNSTLGMCGLPSLDSTEWEMLAAREELLL